MYGHDRANDSWRARIGLVIPSTNTVLEAWMPRVVPDGVSLHTARMPFPRESSLAALEQMEKESGAALRLAADAELDALIYACTASTLTRGRAADLALIATMTGQTGVPCFTITDAIVRGLEHLGAKSVCIASPYPERMDAIERSFFEDCGYRVMAVEGLGITDSAELADPSPGEIYRFARSLWDPGADALLLTCAAFRGHHAVAALEADLGVPVLTSSTAALWEGLRLSGVMEPIAGYGRLLAEPGDAAAWRDVRDSFAKAAQ